MLPRRSPPRRACPPDRRRARRRVTPDSSHPGCAGLQQRATARQLRARWPPTIARDDENSILITIRRRCREQFRAATPLQAGSAVAILGKSGHSEQLRHPAGGHRGDARRDLRQGSRGPLRAGQRAVRALPRTARRQRSSARTIWSSTRGDGAPIHRRRPAGARGGRAAGRSKAWRTSASARRRISSPRACIAIETGAILGLFGISHDITELRLAQETLEQTREALFRSQKMEAVGQLTGGHRARLQQHPRGDSRQPRVAAHPSAERPVRATS